MNPEIQQEFQMYGTIIVQYTLYSIHYTLHRQVNKPELCSGNGVMVKSFILPFFFFFLFSSSLRKLNWPPPKPRDLQSSFSPYFCSGETYQNKTVIRKPNI